MFYEIFDNKMFDCAPLVRTSNPGARTRQTNSHDASSGGKRDGTHKLYDRRPSALERSGQAVIKPPQLRLDLKETFSLVHDCFLFSSNLGIWPESVSRIYRRIPGCTDYKAIPWANFQNFGRVLLSF